MSREAFCGCTNLTDLIFLRGEPCFCPEVRKLVCSGDNVLLDEGVFKEPRMHRAFRDCAKLTSVKVSITWAVSSRMERLSPECTLSVEESICNLPNIVRQDGHFLACFTVAVRDGKVSHLQDTNDVTARSLSQIFRFIAFHELREASIVIELAMWKARIEDATSEHSREDCRVTVPGPAQSLIMEYSGFAGFL